MTPRLDLVPATSELLRAALAGRDALAAALRVEVPGSWPPDHVDRGAIRYALSMLVSPSQRGWWTWFFIERSGRRLVGAGGYKGAPSDGVVEIGYAIVSEHQRRGIATEAAGGLVARAFADPRVERVVAETLAGNVSSIGVLRRCGFVPVEGSSAQGIERFEVRRP